MGSAYKGGKKNREVFRRMGGESDHGQRHRRSSPWCTRYIQGTTAICPPPALPTDSPYPHCPNAQQTLEVSMLILSENATIEIIPAGRLPSEELYSQFFEKVKKIKWLNYKRDEPTPTS
jgi:hypothetical protein